MNKKIVPILISIVLSLCGILYVTRSWRKIEVCPSPGASIGTVVIWNKTDQQVELSLKQIRHEAQTIVVNKCIRACMTVLTKDESSSEVDPISHLYVTYDGKKYRFNDTDMLNAFPNKKGDKPDTKIPTRNFVLFVISAGVGEWENVKRRLEADGKELSEKLNYLVLSNYHKLAHPWDDDAVLSIVKLH
ncbi:hypothetical protein JW872_01270 [Candidatus Babeliales bacterium]|nr:hypothetical protein [Candidatus Babeliales bacterium]